VIGHYTAFVNAASNKIGCGIKSCTSADDSNWGSGGVFMVCKYTPGGNIMGSQGQIAPWIVGSPCAACGGVDSSNCEDNMCTGNVERCFDEVSADSPTAFNGVTYTNCPDVFAAQGAVYQTVCDAGANEESCTTGTIGSYGCAWIDGACSAANVGKSSYCNPTDGTTYAGNCDVSCEKCTTADGFGASFCSGGSGSGGSGSSGSGSSSNSSSDSSGSGGTGSDSSGEGSSSGSSPTPSSGVASNFASRKERITSFTMFAAAAASVMAMA